ILQRVPPATPGCFLDWCPRYRRTPPGSRRAFARLYRLAAHRRRGVESREAAGHTAEPEHERLLLGTIGVLHQRADRSDRASLDGPDERPTGRRHPQEPVGEIVAFVVMGVNGATRGAQAQGHNPVVAPRIGPLLD